MSREYEWHLTEGRLFARAYPEFAEKLALELLRDPEAPISDRWYGWFILGVLAPRTNPALEEFLVEKTSDTLEDDDWDESQFALSCLAGRRLDERCLALCRVQIRRGNPEAFFILSQVVDPLSIPVLKELATWKKEGSYPVSEVPREAEETLRKIAILESGDWESKLQRYLLHWREYYHYREARWALAAAKRRGMGSLKSTLEKRVNEARRIGEPFTPSWSYPEDFNIDRILVAYTEAGGELLPEEEKYLRAYGLWGDAEARLLEVMAERSKYRRR